MPIIPPVPKDYGISDVSIEYLTLAEITDGWMLEKYPRGYRLSGPNPHDLSLLSLAPVRSSVAEALADRWELPVQLQPSLFEEVIREISRP